MNVTLVTVLYEPNWQRTLPLIDTNRVAIDTCGLSGDVLVVDNSPCPSDHKCAQPGVRYHWNQGFNVYLAGALNMAVGMTTGEYVVYFCASHGLVNDPTWLADIIAPLADPNVGLAGHVHPCQFDRVASVPEDIIEPQIHVQGGLWAARRAVLAECGFSHRFPFEFCDVDLSRRLIAAGYELAGVPSIASVAGSVIPDPERYKYVHDYR